jgi:hypothetical protein
MTMTTKKIETEAAELKELVGAVAVEAARKAVAEVAAQFDEKLRGHTHPNLYEPHATPAAIPVEFNTEERVFRDNYTISVHAKIGLLRQKDLSNFQIAKFLNEEQGVTHWTEERIRMFFSRALADGRAFPKDAVRRELDKQAEAEKWSIKRPPIPRINFRTGTAFEEVGVRPTSPAEIFYFENVECLTPKEISRRLKVDVDDLQLFTTQNRKYIDALKWKP